MKAMMLSFVSAMCIPCLALAAGVQGKQINGRFFYSTTPDDGIVLNICPDKASRGADPFFAKHECFIARNVSAISSQFEGARHIKSLAQIDYECGYEGTGAFVVTSFKAHKKANMEGEVETIADAMVVGGGRYKITKSECNPQ